MEYSWYSELDGSYWSINIDSYQLVFCIGPILKLELKLGNVQLRETLGSL